MENSLRTFIPTDFYRKEEKSEKYIKNLVEKAIKNREPSKIEGKFNRASLLSAVEYLEQFIEKTQLKSPYTNIMVANKAVKKENNLYERKYSRRINTLLDIGILTINNAEYSIKNHIARTYDINIDRLIEVRKKCESMTMKKKPLSRVVGNTLYVMDFDKYERCLRYGEWYKIEEAEKEDIDPLSDILSQMENIKTFFEPFYIRTKTEFNNKQKEYLKQTYFSKAVEPSPLYQMITKEAEELAYKEVRMRFTPKVKRRKTKNGFIYTVYASGRQNNPRCQEKKAERENRLEKLGYQAFDWHSTIHSVARWLNTGEFNPDWDLKKTIDYEKYGLTKEQFKQMGMNFQFSQSKKCAYKDYCAWYRKIRMNELDYLHIAQDEDKKAVMAQIKSKLISKEDFNSLYQDWLKSIGGSFYYRYTIFFYESHLEIRVMNELMKLGIEFENVYDCFYFKDISEEEMKKLFVKVANALKQDYMKYST